MKKFLIIAAVLFIAVIVVPTVLIKIYVTPERVKAFIVPTVEKSLDRKVDIGEINIGILRGISLKGFAIKESDQKNDFIKCKEFVLRFKLLPLLSRQLVIDELRLVSPSINIIRSADGRFNFEDIGQKEEIVEAEDESPDGESVGLPVSLLVNNIVFQDAAFSLIDEMKELPDIKSTADIDVSIESSDGSHIFTQGSVNLKLDEMVLRGADEKHIRDIIATLTYAVNFNLESKDIRIDRADLKIPGVAASVTGDINFSGQLMKIDIKSTVNRNTVEIKASVNNYSESPDINLNIYSKQLFIDELIPAWETGEKTPSKDKKTSAEKKPSKDAEPLDLKLSARGEMKVDSAVYRNLTMDDFVLQFIFRDNKLNISKLSARAGKGVISANSLIDLSKPGYKYRLAAKIDSIHAEEIVNSLFPEAKDTVFGNLSMDLKMNGAGTEPGRLKKNLVADGDFNIKDGRITGAPITESLSAFLDIDELETINLRNASGTLKLSDGVARLDTIFASDNLSMNPHGTIGLDKTLDLAMDLRLSPRLMDKAMSSKVAKYIKSEDGWGTVPLIVTGTFEEPLYMVDIEKAGMQIIGKEAEKYIDKLIDDEDDEEKKKQLEPLKEIIKGLF